MVFLLALLPLPGDERMGELRSQVYKYIYYKVQNLEEAEDFTQEVIRRIYPRVKSGEIEEDKLKAYSLSAARNLLNEIWRKRYRQPAPSSLEDLKDKGWEPEAGNGPILEDEIMVRETLAELPPDYRKVLTLRIVEGFSTDEVANIMRRSSSSIRSLQFRAVRAFKDSLQKGGFFDDN